MDRECHNCRLDNICNKRKIYGETCNLWLVKKQCDSCYFYSGGSCKKHAPVLNIENIFNKWPSVSFNNWCGDWEINKDL